MGGPSNQLETGIAVTPVSVLEERPKASLNKEGFDSLIRQKGYPIYIDKTVKCPCSATQNGQGLPGCRNCGGSGYVVYNRRETHAIIHSMNRDTQFKDWSEELLGTASLTTYHEIKISYMDKVTLQEGETIHNELLIVSRFEDDGEYRAGLRYPPLVIETVFFFKGKDSMLQALQLGVDYVIENNQVLRIVDPSILNGIEHPTLSIRYSHRPEYLIIDIPRKAITSLARDPKTNVEGNINFPVHAILKIPHYVLNLDSNDGSYLFNNSFVEKTCGEKKVFINGNGIAIDIYTQDEIEGIATYPGLVIFNETTNQYEGWDGNKWVIFGPNLLWSDNQW